MNNSSNDAISEQQVDSQAPILPRSAWNSNLAYLRVLFRTKKALDRIEKEAGMLTS